MISSQHASAGLPGGYPQDTRIIRIAILLSVALHLLGGWGLSRIEFGPTPDDMAAARDQEVEVFFEPEPVPEEDAEGNEMPEAFTSVPERQAVEEPPEDPDYLAMYHSVAADNKLGDTERPSADEEGEFDQVAIRREELAGAAGVEYTQQPVPDKAPAEARQQEGAPGGEEAEAPGESQSPGGEWVLPEETTRSGGETDGQGRDEATEDQPELEDWWGGPESPSILKEGSDGSLGDRGFDFNQKSIGATTAGVAIVDDFALNTFAWNYAPWLQHFANELHRHWVSPYAYRLGLINGTTVIRLVVEKDGRPSGMEVMEMDGHESLHDASLAALKAFAPYLPLPPDFPEENLVITLSLHYPAFRR